MNNEAEQSTQQITGLDYVNAANDEMEYDARVSAALDPKITNATTTQKPSATLPKSDTTNPLDSFLSQIPLSPEQVTLLNTEVQKLMPTHAANADIHTEPSELDPANTQLASSAQEIDGRS